MIIINFIRDTNVGIFARVKRPPRGTKIAPPPAVELDGGCADEGLPAGRFEAKKREADTVRQRK
jgi:sphingolipid delta-4 desaturase